MPCARTLDSDGGGELASRRPKPPRRRCGGTERARGSAPGGRIRAGAPVGDFQPRARPLTPSAIGKDRMSEGSTLGTPKHLLVGQPIPSHLAHHEPLSKTTGLDILSCDAL